jgi:hypothetical protein
LFVEEMIDFFPSRPAAEAELEKVLCDAPELAADELYVESVDFDVASAPNEGPGVGGAPCLVAPVATPVATRPDSTSPR